MFIELDKHSGVPIFRQIVDQIRHQILTGILPEGSQLMSVRDLSEAIQVNPVTISKAYSLIEMEKLVERRRGIGLFITKPKDELTKKTKHDRLEEMLTSVAVYAVQTKVPESEVQSIFSKLYGSYSTKKGEPNVRG